LTPDRLSFGSQSSVEHSAGYWERQMEANRASVKAWGWERLAPYDSSIDMTIYVAYLQKHYKRSEARGIAAGK
jgi:hypothetical protein